jgi:hypothetical protein
VRRPYAGFPGRRSLAVILSVSPEVPSSLRVQLTARLDEAYRARRGVPPALEASVRAYAHALRVAGIPIERALVDVKTLVAERALDDTPIFIPRIVGWAVAGYFDGASRPAAGEEP